ncbi:hypothetical protein [Roseibium alexandrii]|uniref:Uncharacterized protein n=1 Tax=Roseibium alexandrii (strain DSM 17067 / NCIMB 14079 / DFL-11) TaxID=244592 RepID=A0A5E8H4N2_ROSAD|nr:hypothetical protein [Roseibium alexandrii]EEE47645.1 hypothetical protein SADFL11_4934 [Roseibium alexandrii DFL-11]
MRSELDRQMLGPSVPRALSPETYSALRADGFLEDGQIRRDLVPHLVNSQTIRARFGGHGPAALASLFGAFFKKVRRI